MPVEKQDAFSGIVHHPQSKVCREYSRGPSHGIYLEEGNNKYTKITSKSNKLSILQAYLRKWSLLSVWSIKPLGKHGILTAIINKCT